MHIILFFILLIVLIITAVLGYSTHDLWCLIGGLVGVIITGAALADGYLTMGSVYVEGAWVDNTVLLGGFAWLPIMLTLMNWVILLISEVRD